MHTAVDGAEVDAEVRDDDRTAAAAERNMSHRLHRAASRPEVLVIN